MLVWVVFLLLIFGLLALDLGIFHRSNKEVSMKESLAWTAIWVTLSLLFGTVIYWIYDQNYMGINAAQTDPFRAMIDYYTGYVIEESLSLDNIFVMAMIFKYFRIEQKYQHKILFWGILGAIFFRLVMILLGTAFVKQFEWATYVFGAILIFSAFKMIKGSEEDEDFRNSAGVRFLSKLYPIHWGESNGKYLVRIDGKLFATSLLASLVVVEFSDILFAVDSIPAIFSITTDSFIVFTSNIFAILGLRSLYFFLSNMLDKFEYMKYSLIFVLMFVGVKMLIVQYVHIPALVSLGIILSALILGVMFSALNRR
ncbi:MAG: TerC/Alx family metal homeostasis membrane protein [Bacteroidota bacterium]|jgi:tellurite resistance protein TerC